MRHLLLFAANGLDVGMASRGEIQRWAKGVEAGDRLRRRMLFMGEVNGHPLWTEAEVKTLTGMYPGYDPIIRKLKGRTYHAVRGKAQGLGIQIKRHVWTGAEVARLRKLYPRGSREELQAAYPGVSRNMVSHIANRHGITRARRQFAPTGIPILDQIRQRAFDLGYSMVDLDEMAGTGLYYRKNNWHGSRLKKVDPKAIAAAVRALDGDLVAVWREE